MLTPRQVINYSAHLGGEPYEDWLLANSLLTPFKCQSFLASLGCDDTPGERPVWRASHVDTMKWLCEALGDKASRHVSLRDFVYAIQDWRVESPSSVALREAALRSGFHTATRETTEPPRASLSVAIAAQVQGDLLKVAAIAGTPESIDKRLETALGFVRSTSSHISR